MTFGSYQPNPTDECIKIAQRNYRESPLLRLPAELRMEIWKYVFFVGTIYMKRSIRVECVDVRELPNYNLEPYTNASSPSDLKAEVYHWKVSIAYPMSYPLDLLHVSRLIFDEAHLLPFEMNKFEGGLMNITREVAREWPKDGKAKRETIAKLTRSFVKPRWY